MDGVDANHFPVKMQDFPRTISIFPASQPQREGASQADPVRGSRHQCPLGSPAFLFYETTAVNNLLMLAGVVLPRSVNFLSYVQRHWSNYSAKQLKYVPYHSKPPAT